MDKQTTPTIGIPQPSGILMQVFPIDKNGFVLWTSDRYRMEDTTYEPLQDEVTVPIPTDVTWVQPRWDGEQWVEGKDHPGLPVPLKPDLPGMDVPAIRANPLEVASIAFVALAQAGWLDDCTIAKHAMLFLEWIADVPYQDGDFRRCPEDGFLYRATMQHGAEHTTLPPSQSPTLWTRVADPADEWPKWFMPGYPFTQWMTGSKTTHNGERWVSNVDNNVWEPGIAMWSRVEK